MFYDLSLLIYIDIYFCIHDFLLSISITVFHTSKSFPAFIFCILMGVSLMSLHSTAAFSSLQNVFSPTTTVRESHWKGLKKDADSMV